MGYIKKKKKNGSRPMIFLLCFLQNFLLLHNRSVICISYINTENRKQRNRRLEKNIENVIGKKERRVQQTK